MMRNRHQRHIRLAAYGAAATACLAVIPLVSHIDVTINGKSFDVHGLIGWFCISLCGGLLLKVGAYSLMIRMPYRHELEANRTRSLHWSGWIVFALISVIWLSCAMCMSNVFLGFLPNVGRDIPMLVSTSAGMMVATVMATIFYHGSIGTTYPVPYSIR